jgi:amino acid permease
METTDCTDNAPIRAKALSSYPCCFGTIRGLGVLAVAVEILAAGYWLGVVGTAFWVVGLRE